MFSKFSWPTALLYLWAFVCSAAMSGFHPLTVFFLPLCVVVYLLRGRLPSHRWSIGLGSLGALLFAGGVWQSSTDSGYLLGVASLALVVFLGLELMLFTLLRPSQATRLVVPGLSGALLVACSMSLHFMPVAIVASVAIILLAWALRDKLGLNSHPLRLLGPMVAMLALGLILATAARWSETRLAYYLNLFAVVPASGIRFPSTASLNSLQQWGGSDVVVLRAYGEDPPTYLVGRTFTQFDERNTWVWKPTKTEITSRETVMIPDGRQLPYFENVTADRTRATPVLIEFPDGGSGFSFFTPRYFAGLATDVPQLHRSNDGMWQVLARDTFSGLYWLFPGRTGWENPGPAEKLSESERAEYLLLPQGLTPEVALQARSVAGAYADHEEKAQRVTSYFQTQFTYGYDYPFESTQTALEEFLQKKPPAHCEFFATAAALMLRAEGVPTRYINGFVVQERSFSNEYFVIRLKHAHAWIEVYLPQQGWVTFDPTPPGTLDAPSTRGPFFSAAIEWVSNLWRQFLGWFRLSPAEMLASARRLLSNLSPTQWLGLFGTLASLWALHRWWQAWRRRPQGLSQGRAEFVAGRHARLTPIFELLQQSVSPPTWRRRDAETPQEWLARLRLSSLDQGTIDRLSRALVGYQAARYGESSDGGKLENLERELSELHLLFKGKSLEARETRDH